jgi:hypothetical protein
MTINQHIYSALVFGYNRDVKNLINQIIINRLSLNY